VGSVVCPVQLAVRRDVPVSLSHQVRAPKEDGAIVAEPPLPEADRLWQTNLHIHRQLINESGPKIMGYPWRELRSDARAGLFGVASDYLQEAGEAVEIPRSGLVVMAGHQPELFHPGVWVKNFALNGLARRLGAMPINLVVDTDTAKSTALHVPLVNTPLPPITENQPSLGIVPFDRAVMGVPYEERAVQDEAMFASLPTRALQAWNFEPILPRFWQAARREAERTPLLGERFVRARRALEREWGCHNLEVPISAVCQTWPYLVFVADILDRLPRFLTSYNESVRDYRRRNGLRSENHPVPDLADEGEWLEAPFWAWRAGAGRRGRLMARLTPEVIELRAGDDPWPSLPRAPEAIVGAIHDLGKRGFKVRSRALTNTLYARLFLCDLFIHGIGGGKYDEVTDAIIRRYYGIEPPAFLILSATLLLPLPHYPAGDCRSLRREARDLFYNPQRHLDDDTRSRPEIAALVARKQTLVQEEPADRHDRRERFRQIREVSELLRPAVRAELEAVGHAEAECEAEVRANAILERRDYPFVLYPERTLRPFCEQFLASGKLAARGD
jgi:hypothetical protein